MGASTPKAPAKREGFSSRRVFIFAAIGSAVGLGNIWRFPYIAFDNGGGAFMIPYIDALLTAGLTFLFFDYALSPCACFVAAGLPPPEPQDRVHRLVAHGY